MTGRVLAGEDGVATVLLTAGVSVLLGLVLLVMSGVSGMWLVLVCLALATAAVVSLSGHPIRTLLCFYVLAAPVAISKAVATGAGVYAPALEITVSDLFLGAIVLLWLAERALGGGEQGGRMRGRPVGMLVVLAFFGWAWVSALHASVLSHGLLAAINLSKYLVVFLVISQLVRTAEDLRWVLAAAAAGLLLQAAVAGLQFATGSMLVMQGMKTSSSATMGYNLSYGGGVEAFRPSGLLQHPVFFASYLVILLPTPLALMLAGPRRLGRFVWACSAVVAIAGTAALVLTLSRGGWIAYAVAAGFLLIAGVRLRLITRTHIVAAAVLGVLAILVTVAVYPQVIHRITGSDQRSAQSRLLMMEQAWSIIKRSPVLGVGMASYVDAASEVRPASYAILDPAFRRTLSSGVVHNGYLVFWAERGIVGLVTALALFGWYVRAFFRTREWRDPVWQLVGLGVVSGLVGQMAMYMFDHGYLDSRPGVLWLVFGLLAAILRMQSEGASPGMSVAHR